MGYFLCCSSVYNDVRPDEYAKGRLALTWTEVPALAAQGHTFVCHTMNHTSNDLADDALVWEIGGAVARMEAELEQKVLAFVWLRGPEWGVEPRADQWLQQAGIQLLISNFSGQSIPINCPIN